MAKIKEILTELQEDFGFDLEKLPEDFDFDKYLEEKSKELEESK